MKRNPYLNYTRLPMENAYNVRELGGYATKKGSITIHHQFLRSENLTDITEEDKTFLIEYGLSGIIDLRSREEALIYPNPFRGNNAVKYINCPLITDGILDLRAVKEVGFDPGEFYVKLVEYKEMLYKIFHFILDNIDGCLLFHTSINQTFFQTFTRQEFMNYFFIRNIHIFFYISAYKLFITFCFSHFFIHILDM